MDNKLEKYIWKDKRFTTDRKEQQIEYKMIQFDEYQLQTCYKQCKEMLYNTDPTRVGRMIVLENIQKQLLYCNAELAARHFLSLKNDDGEILYCASTLTDEVREWLRAINDNNAYQDKNKVTLGDIISVPTEFKLVPVNIFYKAVRNQLGIFDHSKLSFNFIYKLGIYLTPTELKELEVHTNNPSLSSKFTELKTQLFLKDDVELLANPNGLTAQEFRDIINLKKRKFDKCKYCDLSTAQLKLLRNKVLYKFEDLVLKQCEKWKQLMKQLEEVAQYKNCELE